MTWAEVGVAFVIGVFIAFVHTWLWQYFFPEIVHNVPVIFLLAVGNLMIMMFTQEAVKVIRYGKL